MAEHKTDFTFHELTNIALGAPTLTQDHLNILYGLLMCVLRKLGCNNETVTIKGSAAVFLKKILESSDVPLFTFHYKNENCLAKRYKQLATVESRTRQVNEKLVKHFEQVRKCNRALSYDKLFWEVYPTGYEEINEDHSDWRIRDNKFFIYKLRQQITKHVLEKLTALGERIGELRENLAETERNFDEAMEQLAVVGPLFEDVHHLIQGVNEKHEEFIHTVFEIQDMLLCKVDRVALPAIRKYLRPLFYKVFDELEDIINVMHKCPTKHAKVTEKNQQQSCLSCGQGKKQFALSRGKVSEIENKCTCDILEREPNLMEKLQRMQMKTIRLKRMSRPSITAANMVRMRTSVSKSTFSTVGDMDEVPTQGIVLRPGFASKMFLPLLTYRTDKSLALPRKSVASIALSNISLFSVG